VQIHAGSQEGGTKSRIVDKRAGRSKEPRRPTDGRFTFREAGALGVDFD